MRLLAHRRFLPLTMSLAASSVILLASTFILLSAEHDAEWLKLFDGRTLQNWTVTNFGGEGTVEIDQERIVLGFGSDLTGITWKGAMPQIDYEVRLEARREEGSDFFCGLTFPVKDSFCSLILGGWGGTVVGLSSIDGLDASENETSSLMSFDQNRWYAVRLKVTAQRIEAWIDSRKIIDQELTGRRIGIRPELELSRPFGLASWRTRAAFRAIAMRKIESGR